MIGKIIADTSGLTSFGGGQTNSEFGKIHKIKTNVTVNKTEWKNSQQKIKAANGDTVKIRTAIDNSSIKDLNNKLLVKTTEQILHKVDLKFTSTIITLICFPNISCSKDTK